MENAIKANHLSMQFGEKVALKDIDFEVQEGEIFGLLGPSGAGKTTIINILTGQLVPTNGTATVLNQQTTKLSSKQYSKIGMVLDNCGLYPRLSCYDNLNIFRRIYGCSQKNLNNALSEVGLENEYKTPASKLSKGMTQRLALARAIMNNPSVLFLDEPTSGLDPMTARKVHNIILSIAQKGTTVFLTTHNMNEATKLCNHVALLNHGTIVEYGSPEELCRKHYKKRMYSIVTNDGTQRILNEADSKQVIKLIEDGFVCTIHSMEPSLEDVFLKLTGEDVSCNENQ